MSIHSLGRERVFGEPRPLSQLLSATCGGGGDIAIATGGWAASRAAAGRVRAGPDIRRGAAAALDGAARATGGPAGTVPRRPRARPRRAPAPSASPRGPAGAARTQPGGAAAQSCGRPRGSEPVPQPPLGPPRTAPLSTPASREVCGQKQDGPARLWIGSRETAGCGDGAAAARGRRAPRPLGPAHAPPSSGSGAGRQPLRR